MKKNVIKNAIIGFGGQFIILLFGLIVPRIMILNYGSDANGVLSTITQIFTYMALLEAGIGQAAKNLLYKPFKDKNVDEISKIYSTSQKYYKKITLYYFAGVLISSVLAPIVIKSDLSFYQIGLICFFQGAAGAISFYYIETQSIVLNVDGKSYVNNTINLVNQIISYLVKIIMAIFGLDIVLIQFIYFIITLLKVFVYKYYFNKNYSWINKTKEVRDVKLEDRNAFIISEIAWTIFSSTDMIVLSIFIGSKLSSVYSVYNMVFVNLNNLLNSIYSSVNYVLGITYHDNVEKYKKLHDDFNSIFMSAITILMICAYTLIIPFVKLYTSGVNDINYIYSLLPVLFSLVQFLSWSRYISGNLVCIAGYAGNAVPINIAEAATNVILSIIFVNIWGIYGVLIATVIALPIKLIYCTYMSDKVILKRKMTNTIKILLSNYLVFFIFVYFNRNINLNITNYFEFCIYGILILFISTLVTLIVNYIVNKDFIKDLKQIKK